MEFDNSDCFDTGWTLNIDADSIVFAQCSIFNDDSDTDRQRITRGIRRKVQELTLDAKCDDYVCFLTTKTNFRDDLVDDYKLNRDVDKKPRPINLAWAKRWTAMNLKSIYKDKLEADDLLGIHSGDNTIIWSIDKYVRQIPGKHLDDSTRKVVTITEEGILKSLGKKVYFDGLAGFYYQCLTGDSTDYIVGCGKRTTKVYKSGAKKGQEYISREGVGPQAALKVIVEAYVQPGEPKANMLEAVRQQYVMLFGAGWQEMLETQANLLYMVREMHEGRFIKRWTHNDREEYFDLVEGVILDDYTPPATKAE